MFTIPSLFPETFFETSAIAYKAEEFPKGSKKAKFLLPDASTLLEEEKFAGVYFLWNPEGIAMECDIEIPFTDCLYPRFQEGDCLEIFLDTRDLKEAGIVHRFCHHFLILPVEVQGVRALEITHFRGEDKHALADPSSLFVESSFEKRGYRLSVKIPKEALFGYDPSTVPRLGFAYRLRRAKGRAQHFPTSSRSCAIERSPSLWATLILED